LDHPKINLQLNIDCKSVLSFKDDYIYYENKVFKNPVIYTGAIDELLQFRFGRLLYRTTDFRFETHPVMRYQPSCVVNYTTDCEFTRITEFKHMTEKMTDNITIICFEYPHDYSGDEGEIPCYPVISNENSVIYKKMKKYCQKWSNLYLLGRLAEFKYYNMDEAVEQALLLSKVILEKY